MIESPTAPRLARWRTVAIVLSLAAGCVAGYLGVVSYQLRGTPWGCGAGSGCADVLKSRWSNVAGIPVGFIAVPVYLALAVLSGTAGPRQAGLLTALCTAVMSSAIYFVLLQALVIGAFCPWCLLDHALGLSASFAAFVIARRLVPRRPTGAMTPARNPLDEFDREVAVEPGRRTSAAGSVIAGVALAMAMVVLQHFTARAPDVARLESSVGEAMEAGAGLTLTLKNGSVTLPVAALPRIGPESAPRRLVLLFDYCCPHCREAHDVIRRLHASAGDAWQVTFVPAPLNATCNPAIEETEDRFKDACELARLSLAVWKLKPGDWPAFDTWLFEPETPRTASQARQHAAALYGELELAEALANADIDATVRTGVDAYQASGSQVLPIILSPGSAGIAGRTDSADELREILEREFGFPRPPAP